MSAEIQVDIRTRFISDDSSVYLLFPGEGYKYYHEMREQSVVFLDLVGFPMPDEGPVAGSPDLVERLVISDRIREWYNKGQPSENQPPRTVAELQGYRRTDYRKQFAGAIGRFFSYIKKGDVIVVPPQSGEDDILFGEVQDDPNSISYIDAPNYYGEKIPCRKVKWLGRKRRQDAPQWLIRKIPSPNPLRQFEKHQHNFIYDLMYERYFYDGEFVCKLSVSSTEFSALDNFLIQQLVLYPAALRENRLDHQGLENFHELPISLAISQLRFSEEIPDQRISIHSPGYIVVYAKNLLPLVIGVLISAAGVSSTDAGQKSVPKINVVNSMDSTAASKKCQGDVQSEVMGDLNAIGYGRWREICLIEFETYNRTKLNTGMPSSPGATKPVQERNR